MINKTESYSNEDSLTAAAIQIKPAGSVEKNLDNAKSLLREAVDRGANLAVLPENFAYYGQTNISATIKNENGETGLVSEFLRTQVKS